MITSIESKLRSRYGETVLTENDIGKVILCVTYNYLVKGILINIYDPIDRGIFVNILDNKNESHYVITGKNGFSVVRMNSITEKHIVSILTNLPQELARHISHYV
jgi:hypothetical protein